MISLKVRMEKFATWWRHTLELYDATTELWTTTQMEKQTEKSNLKATRHADWESDITK